MGDGHPMDSSVLPGGGHFFPLDTNFIRAVGSSAALAESLGFNFPGLLVYMFVGVAIQK